MDIDASAPPVEMDFHTDVRDFQGVDIDEKEDFGESSAVIANDSVITESIDAPIVQQANSVMETDDSTDTPELSFEVKEQILKEVEQMKVNPSLATTVDSVHDEIEKLLNPQGDELTVTDAEQPPEESNTAEPELPAEEEDAADPEKIGKEDMRATLEEVRSLDVFVCGVCHMTYNFLEEFTAHRATCSTTSPFHGGMIEQKPTIWAFLLYKNALVKQNPLKYSGGLTESSWKLYQKWCKMPENARNSWIAAGEAVMTYMSLGNLRKDGNKVVPNRQDKPLAEDDDPKRPVVMKKFCQRDQSGGIMNIRPGGHISSDLRSSISEESETASSKQRIEDEDSQEVLPARPSKKNDQLREEEFVVERIVSRRFNPRRKQYEYLLKWEGYPPEQNTWEPAENLEACQHLLRAFEESLNKQALNKMKNANTARKNDYTPASTSSSSMNNFGRPTRSSKQKALSQVKQWCGSIKPDEAEIETLMKRKLSPTDSDEEDDAFVGKRFRMGSDSEDSLGGRFTNKPGSGIVKKSATPGARGPGRPRKYPLDSLTNGTSGLLRPQGVESSDEGDGKSTMDILSQASVTKSINLSPANQQVLVANAKGVVKVDPAQVPNLSSGVYIMSNKSGIIKLDSVSPSKALSMKQGIVKDISPTLKSTAAPQKSSVVMLNKSQGHEIPHKSGIVRKTQVVAQSPRVPTSSILPGAKTPLRQQHRTTGNIKINTPSPNPNTRFLHSGTGRSNFSVAPKPKTIIRQLEPQRKHLELDQRLVGSSKTGQRTGGILANSLRGVRPGASSIRSGITKVSSSSSLTNISNKGNLGVSERAKLPEGSVSKEVDPPPLPDSESGLPEEFPSDLPQIITASPTRSMTLCQDTGSILLKAENDKLSDPTGLSTVHSETDLSHAPIVIKEEFTEKSSPVPSAGESEQMLTVTQSQPEDPLKNVRSKKEIVTRPKESLVKRTLGKPGSIGSMTVSPKKILPEIEDPDSDVVTITGEDGMIYKVSKSELNNTLLSAGDDQQCIYLTTGENGEESTAVITLDPSSYSEQVNQLGQVNVLGEVGEEEAAQYYVKEGEDGELMDIQVQGPEGTDDSQSQLVAQLVEASEPAPGGGPRRVVLLLPDGNLMMTEVDEEQYAALELDKFQGQPAEMVE